PRRAGRQQLLDRAVPVHLHAHPGGLDRLHDEALRAARGRRSRRGGRRRGGRGGRRDRHRERRGGRAGRRGARGLDLARWGRWSGRRRRRRLDGRRLRGGGRGGEGGRWSRLRARGPGALAAEPGVEQEQRRRQHHEENYADKDRAAAEAGGQGLRRRGGGAGRALSDEGLIAAQRLGGIRLEELAVSADEALDEDRRGQRAELFDLERLEVGPAHARGARNLLQGHALGGAQLAEVASQRAHGRRDLPILYALRGGTVNEGAKLRVGELDGDQPREPRLFHGHAVEDVGRFHGLSVVGNHHELRLRHQLAQDAQEPVDIGV